MLTVEIVKDIIELRKARCLPPHLDNYRLDDAFMPEREDGMKRLRERVQVGTDSNGKPVFKWATGYSQQELIQNAARILIESGQVDAAPLPRTDSPMFNDYVQRWYADIRSKQATG